MVNGKETGTLDRRLYQDSLQLDLPQGAVTLDILVENLGRINFGPYLLQNKKGITEKVLLGGQEVRGWKIYSLPFNRISAFKLPKGAGVIDGPVLRKGSFELSRVADTYLDMRAWGKGSVWVNGHNLGRFWSVGPQQTVYVPVEWLKPGKNEVVVLELLKGGQTQLSSLEKPILDQL